MLTVTCVYSRVVDISKEKPFLLLLIISSQQHCEYVYKGFTVLVSTSELNNLALFTSTHFWFHVGTNYKHLNVYSRFYTEIIKYTPPPTPLFWHRLSAKNPLEVLNLSDVCIVVLQSPTNSPGLPDC